MRDPLEKALKVGVFIVFSVLVLVVAFQIFSRILFPEWSQIWTEEVTRFLFIYSIALAAPLAMKQHAYINIDLVNRLPWKAFTIIKIITDFLVILLFLIIFYFGIKFTGLGISQRAPTVKIPIAIIFVSIPFMGAAMVYYAIINLVRFVKHSGGDARSWS